MSEETALEVAAFSPDEIVLLPLYPQFSTTTTGPLKRWAEIHGVGRRRTVCCYPEAPGWIEARRPTACGRNWRRRATGPCGSVLAHGIPESLITKKGDPYQEQIDRPAPPSPPGRRPTALGICYQSRVGPMKWLGSTEAIARAEVTASASS
jgi:ferrochelatase